MVTIKEALKYPFANFKRLWNFWWVLVPVWGWFVGVGYGIRVIDEILSGKNQELPAIRPFKGLFKTGFLYCVSMLILTFPLSYLLEKIHLSGLYFPDFYELNLLPSVVFVLVGSSLLVIQFSQTKCIRDGINIIQSAKTVWQNPHAYFLTFLKTLVVSLVLLIASIPLITLLITFPVMIFSSNYLWAEFYRENVTGKQKKMRPPVRLKKAVSRRKKK